MPDPHTPSPDALDAALDEVAKEAVNVFEARQVRHPETDKWEVAYRRARAVVRRLAEQGEVGAEWDIVLHSSVGIVEMRTPPGADRWEVYGLDGCKVTGVRVTKVEEAYDAAHPEEAK